jgi:hypothetical protein
MSGSKRKTVKEADLATQAAAGSDTEGVAEGVAESGKKMLKFDPNATAKKGIYGCTRVTREQEAALIRHYISEFEAQETAKTLECVMAYARKVQQKQNYYKNFRVAYVYEGEKTDDDGKMSKKFAVQLYHKTSGYLLAADQTINFPPVLGNKFDAMGMVGDFNHGWKCEGNYDIRKATYKISIPYEVTAKNIPAELAAFSKEVCDWFDDIQKGLWRFVAEQTVGHRPMALLNDDEEQNPDEEERENIRAQRQKKLDQEYDAKIKKEIDELYKVCVDPAATTSQLCVRGSGDPPGSKGYKYRHLACNDNLCIEFKNSKKKDEAADTYKNRIQSQNKQVESSWAAVDDDPVHFGLLFPDGTRTPAESDHPIGLIHDAKREALASFGKSSKCIYAYRQKPVYHLLDGALVELSAHVIQAIREFNDMEAKRGDIFVVPEMYTPRVAVGTNIKPIPKVTIVVGRVKTIYGAIEDKSASTVDADMFSA